MSTASKKLVREIFPLQRGPFKTVDPFLFCVYHRDEYPAGEANLGPHPKFLTDRDLGMDFSYEDGWSMYHGAVVPGFPAHPHRGFETVTVARQGFVDHADSMGYTARYGNGDTQWMTAGRGIQHSEMMPLIHEDKPNTLDLFQIWLNLPKKDKMCPPAFEMFWAESTPTIKVKDTKANLEAHVLVVAGAFPGATTPLAPPPNSWAAKPENDVAIWVVTLPANGSIVLPPAAIGSSANRAIYFIRGRKLAVNNGIDDEEGDTTLLDKSKGVVLDATRSVKLTAYDEQAEVLLLQGRPISEPVVQHGPMVMNTREEISQAFADYQKTQFGGWPWKEHDHVHGKMVGRHAYHDGKTEYPPK